jgi:hypothetical protein
MTRYYNERHKGREPADTPISVGSEWAQDPKREYVSSYCNRIMIKLQDMNSANFSYLCRECNVTTNAEDTDNLRTRSRLQMPEGVNTTPYVSTNFLEPSVNKKPVEPKGSFAALRARGIRIKNYNEHGWRKEKEE